MVEFLNKRCVLYLMMVCSLCLYGGVMARAADQPAAEQPSDSIVTVNIPYDLFLSLARYQELSEAERQEGKNIHNREIIPVLEKIIDIFKAERNRYRSLIQAERWSDELSRRLVRMDKLIEVYQNELQYRRKSRELEQLLIEQKALIELE